MSVYLLTPLVGLSGDAWVSPLSRRPDPRCLRFHHEPVLRHRIVTQTLALENPYLDTAYAICRVRFCFRIVHIGAQGVQWRSEEHTTVLQSLMRISYAVFGLHKTTTSITIFH